MHIFEKADATVVATYADRIDVTGYYPALTHRRLPDDTIVTARLVAADPIQEAAHPGWTARRDALAADRAGDVARRAVLAGGTVTATQIKACTTDADVQALIDTDKDIFYKHLALLVAELARKAGI